MSEFIRRNWGAVRNLGLALVALVVAFVGWRASHTRLGTTSSAASSGPAAPEFELKRLGRGDRIRLADYRGKVVVLNFWASWCGPCKDEAKALERAWHRWSGKDVQFIGVDTRDSAGDAKASLKHDGVSYPMASDTAGETAAKYGVLAMPQTFVISADGRVVRRTVGPVTEADINTSLMHALKAGSHASVQAG